MPTFSADIVTAVLAHMNGDHTDDNLVIARAFGSLDATESTMTTLDGDGGTWEYVLDGETRTVTVPWSTSISERPEIRREVVVTYDRACAILGLAPRGHE